MTRLVLGVVCAALIGASAAFAAVVSWGAPAGVYVGDAQAANRVPVYEGQAGTGAGDFDYTKPLTAPNGDVYQVMPYKLLALPIPADAKYAVLGVKAIITKSSEQNQTTEVFAFARAPGSVCCEGIPGALSQPIDAGFGQYVEGMIQQAVAQLPGDGQRSWSQVTVPVVNGAVEFSWGYRKVAGVWPEGDAVAIDVFVNGFYR
jgi:hypothetical protein